MTSVIQSLRERGAEGGGEWHRIMRGKEMSNNENVKLESEW